MATHREKSLHYPIKFGFPQKGQRWGSSHPLKMGEFPPRQRIYMKQFKCSMNKKIESLAKKQAGNSESKKSEGISDMIDAKIDYNMFMRMCKTAAYLEEDEDYWDALWDFYSEGGSIGDALVFFDNLFQYTAWKDVDETYDELAESDQDGSKSKEECIEAVLDRDGEIRGNLVRNYGDHYLWVY